jgi:hypothetical protein
MDVCLLCMLHSKDNRDDQNKRSNTDEVKRAKKKNLSGGEISAPVQTGPGAHPASYKMGTGSLSRG